MVEETLIVKQANENLESKLDFIKTEKDFFEVARFCREANETLYSGIELSPESVNAVQIGLTLY